MRHDVFISYAVRDAASAETVCRAVEDAGIACWIAPRDALAGEIYADAIVEAISAARAAGRPAAFKAPTAADGQCSGERP
jgi:TIR domain